MSRIAFTPASGCTSTVVTLVDDTSLPICSVPSMADPGFADKVNILGLPDIAPPIECVCLDFSVIYSAPNITGSTGIGLNMGLNRRNPTTTDCCDGNYDFSFDMDIPCMPTNTSVGKAIAVTNAAAAVALTLARNTAGEDACQLDLDFSINLPCIPFSVKAYVSSNIITPTIAVVAVPGTPSMRLELTQESCLVGVDGALAFEIPCVPFDMDVTLSGAPSIEVAAIDLSDPASLETAGAKLKLKQASGAPCKVQVEGEIKVPCIPFIMQGSAEAPDISVTPYSVVLLENPPYVVAKLWLSGVSCDVAVTGSIPIPCVPFNVDASVDVGISIPVNPIDLSADPIEAAGAHIVLKPEAGCLVRVDGDIKVPCIPFIMGGNSHAPSIAVTPVSGTPVTKLWLSATKCSVVVAGSVEVPCIPFTLEGSGSATAFTNSNGVTNTSGATGAVTMKAWLSVVDCELRIAGSIAIELGGITGTGSGGGLPSGYVSTAVRMVCASGVYSTVLLIKSRAALTHSGATWASTDVRKLLQVNSNGLVRADLGYLRA